MKHSHPIQSSSSYSRLMPLLLSLQSHKYAEARQLSAVSSHCSLWVLGTALSPWTRLAGFRGKLSHFTSLRSKNSFFLQFSPFVTSLWTQYFLLSFHTPNCSFLLRLSEYSTLPEFPVSLYVFCSASDVGGLLNVCALAFTVCKGTKMHMGNSS